MILRKPTRIELKPQQDSQQYQDFKLKLSQAGKIKKPIESTFKTNVLGSIKTTTKNSRIMSSETRSYFPEMFSRFPMAGEDSPERMDRFGGRREEREREREGESGSGGHSIYSMNPEGEYSGDGRFMM